jgi:hypothetical protein
MMDTIISTFFRFLDFFVITAVVVYGIKHYLIPAVEKMWKEYNVFTYNLEKDCKDLQLQSQAIYENIQDQDRKFQAMQYNFALWQKICQSQLIIKQQEQECIDIKIQDRFKIKSNFIQNDTLIQEQLPMILDEVTCQLHDQYRGVEQQKQYIDVLINFMKEQS